MKKEKIKKGRKYPILKPKNEEEEQKRKFANTTKYEVWKDDDESWREQE